MNSKVKQFKTMFMLISLLLVGLIMLNGCKKSEPTPSETSDTAMIDEAAEVVASVASAAEQTTCPIMGTAINKALFVEYKGKKVYFCCPGCEDKFNEEPEKYIAKLPQFKQ